MHILNSRISADILQWHVNCGLQPTRLLCGGLYYYFFNFETGSYYVTLTDPGTYCVDQAGLKLRHLPVSASQVLGLKMCTVPVIPCMPCGFLMVILEISLKT